MLHVLQRQLSSRHVDAGDQAKLGLPSSEWLKDIFWCVGKHAIIQHCLSGEYSKSLILRGDP